MWALKALRPYLLFEEFIVHTVHASLRCMITIEDPSGRLMRWRLRLAEYTVQIAYRKGSQNQTADALSRLTTLAEAVADDFDDVLAFLLTHEDCDCTYCSYGATHHETPKLRFKIHSRDNDLH